MQIMHLLAGANNQEKAKTLVYNSMLKILC